MPVLSRVGHTNGFMRLALKESFRWIIPCGRSGVADPRTALLGHMHQFVGQERLPLPALGRVRSPPEEHVLPAREGVGLQGAVELIRLLVGVHTNASEIGAECSLHRAPDRIRHVLASTGVVDGVRDPRRCLTRLSVAGGWRGGERTGDLLGDPVRLPLVPIVSRTDDELRSKSTPPAQLVDECAGPSVGRGGCRRLGGGPPADRRPPAELANGPPDLAAIGLAAAATRPSCPLSPRRRSWTDGWTRRAPTVDVTLAPSRFRTRGPRSER